MTKPVSSKSLVQKEEQRRESELKTCHSKISNHVEEIAFIQGAESAELVKVKSLLEKVKR